MCFRTVRSTVFVDGLSSFHDQSLLPHMPRRGMGLRNHPDRVWDEDLGCQCGAGMPCECQHGLEQPDTSKVISVSRDLPDGRVSSRAFRIDAGSNRRCACVDPWSITKRHHVSRWCCRHSFPAQEKRQHQVSCSRLSARVSRGVRPREFMRTVERAVGPRTALRLVRRELFLDLIV